MTRDQWLEMVKTGNGVWNKQPLAEDAVGVFFDRLRHWDDDVVLEALGRLAQTEAWWPSLAAIVTECGNVERVTEGRAEVTRALSEASKPGIRLRDWLRQGAPGYPGGKADAVRIWSQVFALSKQPRAVSDDAPRRAGEEAA